MADGSNGTLSITNVSLPNYPAAAFGWAIEDCLEAHHALPDTNVGWNEIRSAFVSVAVYFVVMWLAITVLGCLPRFRAAVTPLLPDSARGLRSWFRNFLECHDDTPLSLDAKVLLAFSTMGLRFSIVGTLFAIVIVPIFAFADGTGGGHREFGKLTFNHFVASRSNYRDTWLSVICAYCLATSLMWMLAREWRRFIKLRHKETLETALSAQLLPGGTALGPEAQVAHSVIVENLPRAIKTDEDLRARLDRLFGEDIFECHIVKDELAAEAQKPACCSRCLAGCFRMLRFYFRCARFIYKFFHRLEYGDQVTTAIVTFRSMVKRNVAIQSDALFDSQTNASAWDIRAAPPPQDIIWHLLPFSARQAIVRQRVVNVICFFMLFVWWIPFAGVLTVTSPVFWQATWPQLFEEIERVVPRFWMSLFTAQLPMLAISGGLTVLPWIFEGICWLLEGEKTRSSIQRQTFFRTFVFYSATYYLLALGGSAALSVYRTQVGEVVRRPLCVLTMLGTLLPQVAVYYIVLVLNQLAALPFIILRVSRLWLVFRQELPDTPAYIDVGWEGVRIATALNLACMFCVLCPMIMPFCLLFFFVARCHYRWAFQHLYGGDKIRGHREVQPFPGNGSIWYELFPCTMLGLVLGTTAVFGVMLTSVMAQPRDWSPTLASIAVAILLILEVRFWFAYSTDTQTLAEAVPYEDALNIDAHEAHAAVVAKFTPDFYSNPSGGSILDAT